MFKPLNYETKELCVTNQDLRTYIGGVKKERTAYPEQNTLYFEKLQILSSIVIV